MPYLRVTQLIFEDQLYDRLLASSLERGSLSIAYKSYVQFNSPSFTGNIQFPFQIATGSLDRLYGMLRPAAITAYNFALAQGTGAEYVAGAYALVQPPTTYRYLMNGSPLTSYPEQAIDAWVGYLDALDGHTTLGGVKFPRQGTWANWLSQNFAYVHRLEMAYVSDSEAAHSITGLSTYGVAIPSVFEVMSASIAAGVTAVVIAECTAVATLSAGRLISVTQ